MSFFEMNFISWLESLKTRAVNVSNSITCGTNHNFANEVWTLVWSGNSMVYARWLVHSLAALLIFKYLDSPSECFRAHSSRIFQHGLQKKCKNKKWCSSTWKFVLFQVQNGDFFIVGSCTMLYNADNIIHRSWAGLMKPWNCFSIY